MEVPDSFPTLKKYLRATNRGRTRDEQGTDQRSIKLIAARYAHCDTACSVAMDGTREPTATASASKLPCTNHQRTKGTTALTWRGGGAGPGTKPDIAGLGADACSPGIDPKAVKLIERFVQLPDLLFDVPARHGLRAQRIVFPDIP